MKKISLLVLVLFLIVMGAHAEKIPHWITSADNKNAANSWLCFQKVYTLKSVPRSALARIAVDSKYWLWINGKPVVLEGAVKRGPNPQDTYYDRIEIAPYLKRGDNLISVLVWHYGKKGFSHNPSGVAALFFDCNVKEAPLVSDGSWTARLHPAYFTPGQPDPNYRLPESNLGFDARKDICGWEQTLNADWQKASELGCEGDAPWNKLRFRIIPQWKDFGLKDYVKEEVHTGKECDTLVCRLPYNAQVMPYVRLEAEEGQTVRMVTDNYFGGGEPNVRAEYVTVAGVQEYENKGWMNGETMYYIYPKGVKIQKVQFRETGYDTELEGYFHCDDEFLNRYWQKAQRTLYVTMRDTYMDCPDRERAQWWGDEVNESGEAFYALSVSSHLLMKKGMYELIGWQTPAGAIHAPVPASNFDAELPGQMLNSVGYYGFWNYYLNTGDLEPIRDLYAGVKKYLSIWEKEENGTMKQRAGGWNWGDWGDNIDKTALYNAWYYLALKGEYKMAEAMGMADEMARISKEMVALKGAFNRVYWNGEAYRHPEYAGDTDDRVQALAVIAGLADKEKYPAILKLLKRCEHASPYMEKYVTEALFKMGEGAYGLQRMKKRFAEMVNDSYRTTLYEGWGVGSNGFGGGTTNHAWSGGGLTILSQYVCGVSPLKPGFREWMVAPCPAGVRQAETFIPTVSGNIKVAFVDSSDSFALSVSVPKETEALVCMPLDSKEIRLNGKLVWKNGQMVGRRSYIRPDGSVSSAIAFRVSKAGDWNFISLR